MGISLTPKSSLTSGNVATSSIQKPRQNENTIRICRGTIREPKNGAAIKKAPTLSEETKMRIKNILNS